MTNVYSLPARTYNEINTGSAIYTLPRILEREGDHVVVGDFNIHHPQWTNNPQGYTHHMAQDLLNITERSGLQLILPPGTTIWHRGTSTSTLDLPFCSQNLAQHLVTCGVDSTLEHGSDHLPVVSHFGILETGVRSETPPKRIWKHMDHKAIQAGSKYLQIRQCFTSRAQIDTYVEYLQKFIL
jgi:hypothetical protein